MTTPLIAFPRSDDAYITSLEIAQKAKLTHAWVLRSVKNHVEELTHGGPMRFQDGHAVLNIAQAWLFMGYLRNTESSTRLKWQVASDFSDAFSKRCEAVGLTMIDIFNRTLS